MFLRDRQVSAGLNLSIWATVTENKREETCSLEGYTYVSNVLFDNLHPSLIPHNYYIM
jgi:hypothetical protein